AVLKQLADDMAAALDAPQRAAPIVGGKARDGHSRPVLDPTDNRRVVGEVAEADAALVEEAVGLAVAAQPGWDGVPAEERATILDRAADDIEARMPEFLALCVREAGKSAPDAIAEVREAIDHVRYNAMQCRRQFAERIRLPGPTGESNHL